jgi:hypothetical protein
MNEGQFQDLLRKTSDENNIILDILERDNSLLNRKARTSENTLLHYACLFSNLVLVKELVKRGSNIHLKNSNAIDALYQAVQGHNKNFPIISFLLEKGADPCSKTKYWTALGWASIYADLEICLLLLSYGADLLETMYGTVGKIKENSTAIELYGEFYGIDWTKKEKECKMLQLAWLNGPHPTQVKRRNWERRWPFLQVLYFNGFQHLKYRLELLKSCASFRFLAKKAAFSTNVSIQSLDVSKNEKRFAALIRWIFSHPDIWRIIIFFI